MALLEIRAVSKAFGGLQAVNHVDAVVEEGSITALIGPNGSGKSTLLNIISCLLKADSGTVWFRGERIDHLEAHEIPGKGIGRTFQIIHPLAELSVLDNVMLGAHARTKAEMLPVILRLPWVVKEETKTRERALQALEFVGLRHRAEMRAGLLPFGQIRLLELARALCAAPQMLLLDEPVSGLNPEEAELFGEKLLEVRQKGCTIVFVEHEMRTVMRLAQKIIVLNFGLKIAEGMPEEIRRNRQVIDVYLGEEA